MASIGLKYLAWAAMATEPTSSVPTYSAGLELAEMVSINLAIQNAEGELYTNDQLTEFLKEFMSGTLTMEVGNITLANQATLYGATITDGELVHTPADVAPYGGIGGYQQLVVSGTKKWRAWFFPKVQASVPDWSGNTKNNSISFGTQPMSFKVLAPKYGPWRYVKEFTTEAAAKAYIDSKLGVVAWREIDVQVNGAGAGEAATPYGISYVANAGTFTLTVTGTVTALYDNGVERKASIANGAYTLSNVTAAHKIAVVF